jgi:AcrR family transcriptional regulator
MIDDHRIRILTAAAKVYAQHGWRGATTRRIADEAGVNEVTLFRQFGSKNALFQHMLSEWARREASMSLPVSPEHPAEELLQWVTAHHTKLNRNRDLVRQMMCDANERPDAAGCASHGPSSAAAQLREYVVQLRRHGWIDDSGDVSPVQVSAAVTMLMSALFNDAMNRDLIPEMFPQSVTETLRGYVQVFLRGLGCASEPSPAASRTLHGSSVSSFVSE